jgi:hypothetical protein
MTPANTFAMPQDLPPQDPPKSEPRRPSVMRTIKAVAWGFFGVRKNSAYQEDIQRLTPLHVVGVGLVAVVLLVLALVAVVKFVVAP